MAGRAGKSSRRDPSGLACLTLAFNPQDLGVVVPRQMTGPKPNRHVARSPGYAPETRSTKYRPNCDQARPGNSSTRHPSSPSSGSSSLGSAQYSHYQRKLHTDIDRLLLDDEPPRTRRKAPRSETKANDVDNDNHQLTKDELRKEYIRIAQSLLHPNQTLASSRTTSSISAQSFLIDDLVNNPITLLDSKLGRPTRTTLLRNRQRCNSAPIISFESREEAKRRTQLLLEQRSSRPATASCSRETSISQHIDGETVHAFLTGARYNRAHHVDAKSLSKYGVYMPRSNPKACFVNENKFKLGATHQDRHREDLVPPASPCRDTDMYDEYVADDTEDLTHAPPSTPSHQHSAVFHELRLHDDPGAYSGHAAHQSRVGHVTRSATARASRHAWAAEMDGGGGDDGEPAGGDGQTVAPSEIVFTAPPVIGRTQSKSAGPILNITGRKLQFGLGVRPHSATLLAPTTSTLYETPPPPPSVDMNYRGVRKPDFSSASGDSKSEPRSRGLKTTSVAELNRTVRFSELKTESGDPKSLDVLGHSIFSPKHRSILKSEENFFGLDPSNLTPFFVTETEDFADEALIDEVIVGEELSQESSIDIDERLVHDIVGNSISEAIAELTAEHRRKAAEDDEDVLDEDVTDVVEKVSREWMATAGVEMQSDDDDDDDMEDEGPTIPVIAVDISTRTTD